MKNLLIITFTSLLLLINKQEQSSKVVTFKIPHSMESKQKDEILTKQRAYFKRGAMTAAMEHQYKFGNIFFGFHDNISNGNSDLNRVLSTFYDQPESKKMNKEVTSAEIVQYKNTKFVVNKSFIGDEGLYQFISEAKNNNSFAGAICFKKKDGDKAKKILDKFLNSVIMK